MDGDPLLPRASAMVDYRGRQISRSNSGGWTAALFIIGVEISERFAYYGVSSNLIMYLTTGPLGESTSAAASAVNVWSGVSSMLPLIGAFVADSFLGRYRTILIASVLYLLGLGMLTLFTVLPAFHPPECLDTADPTNCPSLSNFQVTFFFLSLYLIAFAQGGHKPCVQAFGADQFDEKDPEESASKSSFFNWWYFGMCMGTAVSLLILNYIQDSIGWGLGFGIPCVSMGVALAVFLAGTKTYRYHRLRNKSLLDGSASTSDDRPNDSPIKEVEDANNVSQAEEAKGLLRLFPIWATCLIYAVVFAQSSTFFTKQGSTMDRRIGSKLLVPPAALQTFISLSIAAFIPIYDRVLVPITRKITGAPSGITMLQRIGIGMLLSTIAMMIAAMVEIERLKIALEFGLVDLPAATIPMSLWWLVPQYVLYGISDVFTMVGLQEFFYDQVPDGLRSLGLALYLSIFGVGNFISGFLVSMIDRVTSRAGDSWFSNNLNRAHLDYFYWLLAGLSAAEVLIYIYFAKSYVYKRKSGTISV